MLYSTQIQILTVYRSRQDLYKEYLYYNTRSLYSQEKTIKGAIFMEKTSLIKNTFNHSTNEATLKYLGLTYREIVNRIFNYSSPKMTLKYLGIDKEAK